MRRLGHAPFLAALAACTSEEPPQTFQPPPAAAFSSRVDEVVLEVDYAPGAEPYVGPSGVLEDAWSLTRENLGALFAAAPRTVTVPNALADMQRIEVPAGPYGGDEIVDIAFEHRGTWSTERTTSFYVVFLDGFFEDDDGTQDAVLGASLPDFGIVVLFKPVVRTLETAAATAISVFTEQSALVHELGHSLGLVGTGIPAVTAHVDAEHPGHCTNRRCVMFWANEGPFDLRTFVADLVDTGNRVLFDDACLEDAGAAAEAGREP